MVYPFSPPLPPKGKLEGSLLPQWSSSQYSFNIYDSPTMCPEQDFSISTTDIQGGIILCGGGCPAYRRMLNSIPGLDPPDASSSVPLPPPHSVTSYYVSRHCQISLGSKFTAG